jgi:cysteinyl-tRNA synthetase
MSELRLYNTLTRMKERFSPIDPDNVRMYVCGPTVYDYAHIGNARPVIVFDVLFRLLRHLYGEQHVTYVRNITDVDDKINARALRDFPDLPLNEAIARITGETTARFHEDVAVLGCLPPTVEPRATGHIDGMISMIQTLIDKRHAYVAIGSEGVEVLFDVASMPEYGRLSRRRLEEQQAGARVAVEAHKKNPADFVLWKESTATEPGWEAQFKENGVRTVIRGRPGWHIECSVMARAHLGEVFDIHGGGLDLIFPHHENEIAQSRCAHDTPVMANVWMHNGFLQVEGKKMAKSEGNFVTIHDLLRTEKFGGFAWPGSVVRFAMLKTHYRQPIDFSVKTLEDASIELERLWCEADWDDANALPSPNFITTLCEDLNSPLAIAEMHKLASKQVWASALEPGHEVPDVSFELGEYRSSKAQLAANLRLVGIEKIDFDPNWMKTRFDNYKIERNIDERLELLREKNFAEADKIRDELAAQGIQLMDYKDPDTGERKTKWEVRR